MPRKHRKDISIELLGPMKLPEGRRRIVRSPGPDGTITVEELLLSAGFTKSVMNGLLVARNGMILQPEEILKAGDKVTVFLPLSGD